MKSIFVASSCACLVTSVAWSMAVLIFSEPPPALAEESPRVHQLQEAVQDLQRTVADMQRKVRNLDEPQVWRMEEPEDPAEAAPFDRSHEFLAAVQQKSGEINALGRRVDGIEEYLRYGGDFNPEHPGPVILAQDLTTLERAPIVGRTFRPTQSGSYQVIQQGALRLQTLTDSEGRRVWSSASFEEQPQNGGARGWILETGEIIEGGSRSGRGDD